MQRKTLEHTGLTGMLTSNPLPKSSGNPLEKEADKVKEAEGTEHIKRVRPSNSVEENSHEFRD